MDVHDAGLIHVHQIGSRGGNVSWFPRLRAFRDECVFHQYDADGNCTEQVERIITDSGIRYTNHTCILGKTDGDGRININYDPFTSSVHLLNPRFADCYIDHPEQGDYILGQTFKMVESRVAPAASIDRLADEGVIFDVLELDTQGSEIDILEGGARTISDSVFGVFTEISLDEAYQGQCLFEDVLSFCRRHGFRFISFHDHRPTSWLRAPLGWRGDGLCVFADALFLKSPDRVLSDHKQPYLSLMKLAFSTLVSGRTEYALECLQAAANLPVPAGAERRYVKILSGLYKIYQREIPLQGVEYQDVWSLAESMKRFRPERSSSEIWTRDHHAIRERYFQHTDPRLFRDRIRALASGELTVAEQFLADNDLALTAGRMRARRREQAMQVLALLGFTRKLGDTEVIDDRALDAFVAARGG
mgnify:CR=1 FL=1